MLFNPEESEYLLVSPFSLGVTIRTLPPADILAIGVNESIEVLLTVVVQP